MGDTLSVKDSGQVGTSQKSILAQVWSIAWPVVTASMLDATEGMVDIFLVGKLGPEAISGVGMSRQIVFVMMVVMMSITAGTRTLVAQLYGAGRLDELRRTAEQSVILGVLFSVVLGLAGVLVTEPLLMLLGATGDVLAYGSPYLRLYFAGSGFLVLNFVIGAIFGGLGDTRTPLKISSVIIVVKLFTTYGLLFGAWGLPEMGVSGAAMGTVISRALGTVLALWILIKGYSRIKLGWRWHLGLDRDIIRKMMSIGIPSGITGFFRNGARVLMYRVAAGTGNPTASIAALTIGFQVRLVAIMPALAFSIAATALVGQRLGAKEIPAAERYGADTIRLCMIFIAGCGTLVLVFASEIVSAFTTSTDVIVIGYEMLWFFTIAQLFSGLSIVAGGVMAGGGETRPPLYYTIIGQWGIMLPLSSILVFLAGFDTTGIWVAWMLGGMAQGIMTYRRYLKGTWKVTVV